MAIIQETKIKAGYEEIHAMATAKLETLEDAIRKEVEERIAGDKKALLGIISECLEVVDVEVPDETESEVNTETEVQTEEVVY